MRQSLKHKMIVSPENQMQHASYSEVLGRSPNFCDVEMSSEFASMQEKLKNTVKKSFR
ncbi:hypothetical protein [Paenibacillus sp. GP183]|uniref:hypothetical protein n=1 Tax=Paenibacillus sp. GP183 TaxID=1882751 RepID=UPI000899ADE0|nr:hypothetical protein [Paenibacillus sp. GP183]SEC73432.1 hypothetical protein SAMN05443246_5176 [Paenibacillus sp. GP183]